MADGRKRCVYPGFSVISLPKKALVSTLYAVVSTMPDRLAGVVAF